MNDEQWSAWLERRRAESPPEQLADRVLQQIAEEQAIAPSTLSRVFVVERLAQVLLWTAASVVCVVRLYSTVGLLLPAFAFTEKPPEIPSGTDHAEHVASNW